MEQIVTGCTDCPLCSSQEFHYFCLHPKYEDKYFELDTVDLDTPITPDDCPLNKEPITITKNK